MTAASGARGARPLGTSARGFGVAGAYPAATIQAAGIAAERAGYHTFWLSQPASGDSLARLADLATVTRDIRLGVGAIPFTREPADAMVARVRDLAMPRERLRLGVGSGTGNGSLARLRDGVGILRAHLDVEIVVAPLGPKMCRLAGKVADTVLLTWVTADHAATSVAWVAEGATGVGRKPPTVVAYVRCALGEAALPKLDADHERYGSLPHYAAHFRRQGVDPSAATILATSEVELRERLRAYEAVLDEVVVRAVTPNDSIDEVMAIIDATKPEPWSSTR